MNIRNWKGRVMLLSAVSMQALVMSQPAAAQTTGDTTDTVQAEDNTAVLGTVTVTAQKRAQNLQDVPVAVSALDSSALEERGVSETSDLMGLMPNLQITTAYGKTQPNFSLRGISVANEFSASTASPVGVYVDEVYQSFRASHGQQLYDLDRVEVLRGPQGTLYGRNTTGGAVSFLTRKPSLAGSNGEVSLGYANYNTLSADAALERTLVEDQLGIRLAGTYSKGDGYMYNPLQGRDIGTTDTYAGRLSLRWQPTSDLDINFKLYGARDNPVAPTPYAIGQLAGQRDALGYSRFDPTLNNGRALQEDEVSADTGGNYYTKTAGGSLTIQYDLADDWTFTSITGYDESEYHNSPFDCDGSPNSVCALRYNTESENFNQDLRLTYQGDRLSLVSGLYYGKDTVDTHNEIDFFGVLRPLLLGAGLPGSYSNPAIATPDSIGVLPGFAVDPTLQPGDAGFCDAVVINPNGFLDARSLLALLTDISIDNSGGGGFGGAYSAACRDAGAPPFSPILGDQYYVIERPSSAIYADASYDLTDRLTVALGLRYTWDEVEYKNGRTTLFDLAGETIVASTIPYSFPYDPSLPPVRQSEKEEQFTGRLNVSYDFTDDIMAYANFSRGYRSGTFNGLAYQGTNQVYYIEPEQIDAYEAGLKSRFWSGRAQLNLAAFLYQYDNHQVTQVIGATTFTRSADGELSGAEAELALQLLDNLRIDGTIGFLETEYKDNVIDPADPSSPTMNVNGNPFPNAPDLTFNAGATWDIGSFAGGNVTLRADASYMGEYYFDPFKDYGQSPCDQPASGFNILQAGPAIACGNPSYWLYNARLTYENEDWKVSLWGKNLSDEFYYTYGLNINIFNLDYLNRGVPRTYGIEFTKSF